MNKKYLVRLYICISAFLAGLLTSCIGPAVRTRIINLDGSSSENVPENRDPLIIHCNASYDNFMDISYIKNRSGYTTINAVLRWESSDGIQAGFQLMNGNEQASATVNFENDFCVVSGACLAGATYTDWSTGSAKTADCVDSATRLQFFIQDSSYAPTDGIIYIKNLWLSGPGLNERVLFCVGNYDPSAELSIKTTLNTSALTKDNVVINIYTSKTNISRIGYVYNDYYTDYYDTYSVLHNGYFMDAEKYDKGEYRITASSNGYYWIAAQDTYGNMTSHLLHITNIDKTPPSRVTNLHAEYDDVKKEITITWTNPSDSDFDHAELSCKKNGTTISSGIHISNGSYVLKNIENEDAEYSFSVCTVDKVGNRSSYSTKRIRLDNTIINYSVGDVLLNDGTIIPYDADNLSFTDEQKQKAVGIVYGLDENGGPRGYLGLYNSAGGTNSGYYQWAIEGTIGRYTNFTGIICDASENTVGSAATATFTGDTDGSDNWEYICLIDPEGAADAETNYPMFNYANTYGSTFNLTGDYETGWYIPSLAELCYIYRNCSILNSILESLNGIPLINDFYYSSSQSSVHQCAVGSVHFNNGEACYGNKDYEYEYVCVVRPFTN